MASREEFESRNWARFVENQSKAWAEFYAFYLEHYKPNQVHILHYDTLKTDLKASLSTLMKFLDFRMPKDVENCVLNKKSGSNRRAKSNLDLRKFFTANQKIIIDGYKQDIQNKLIAYAES